MQLGLAHRSFEPEQQAIVNTGTVNSEGDTTHRAAFARTTYSVNGSGVNIGVLSDGVTHLADSQASGNLPAVTVVPGQAGTGDEGTAMLEIIYDLAPGAQLYFATARGGSTVLAQNIRTLRNTYNCDIIVDDFFYIAETPFQDGQAPSIISNFNGGIIAQAVKDVTASGALYFSSAGNSGNLSNGMSGVWEGNFVDGGASSLEIGRTHNFGGQLYDVLTVTNTSLPITLHWSDPLGGSSNDYDLVRLDSTGNTVLSASANDQTGTQDPFEAVTGGFAGDHIVIIKYTGAGTPADRFLHLNTNRGRLSIATAGQIQGHAAVNSAGAFGVAATPASGPYPNPFTSSNHV